MSVLTRNELEAFRRRISVDDRRAWPKEYIGELLDLEPNERDTIALLAVHLDARIVDYPDSRRRTWKTRRR